MKKIIIFLLAAVAMLASVSCVPEDVANETSQHETTAPETTSEPTAPELVLVDGGKTDFKVVRAEGAKGFAFDTATAALSFVKCTDGFYVGLGGATFAHADNGRILKITYGG